MSDLFQHQERGWNTQMVVRLFDDLLVERLLSLAIPILQRLDVRAWQSSCSFKSITKALSHLQGWAEEDDWWYIDLKTQYSSKCEFSPQESYRSRLPTRALLRAREIGIPTTCLSCGIKDETLEYVLFQCQRAMRVWWLATPSLPDTSMELSIQSFLEALRWSTEFEASSIVGINDVYTTY